MGRKSQHLYGLYRVLYRYFQVKVGLTGKMQFKAAFLFPLSLQNGAQRRGAAGAGDRDVG